MAKLYAGDTAMWVSERAIQVLGGYGYTKEFPVERFFRPKTHSKKASMELKYFLSVKFHFFVLGLGETSSCILGA